ncbi:L-idonate 5-dehydrogenase [Marinovum sp. 2_MG-2023]|uniref:L-idonate 5-dehydrogenase n=1 Tax=unclassified Marinovum TaxID=2647166 RepID=UPI0026E14278|nr:MULTISPECIES: L-idonate 5-dehydrogenase [unclassified Marinovum]MDO6732778.1 L-idonate 5-dehydrogenase [Marinovum sp. 2_MG-2023]MDO6781882.1 L-idonate 5-dehydrogenase [Marinovum sp. 1_MG-2023]
MKALFAHGAHDLRLSSFDETTPGEGEVSVKLARGGICGSDLHYFNHGGFGPVRLREPMVLGHEVSGVVAALGAGVTGLQEGDLVAVSPSRPCGTCSECQRGLANQCLNMAFYGSAMPFPHIQGAFREMLVAKASQCVPAHGLTPAQAAMAEPLSVGLHAVRRAGEMLGRRVLITGCGPIGVLAIMAARRAGAAEIIACDINAPALTFAKSAGADVVLNTLETPDALAPYCTGKGQLDVLFECSGAQPALAAGIAALRPRGIIVQLGLSGDMSLPMMALTAKELDLRGSFRFHEEFAVAVQLMQKGLIDPAPLLTHTFPLAEFASAFATASDKSQSMKVQLDFA